MDQALTLAGCLAVLLALGACTPAEPQAGQAFSPAYQGIETLLLDGDLVNFRVTMTGARNDADVATYARCAAAQYALIRGFGFARLVRTTVAKNGDTWTGDAVYTISAALPRGFRTIDAEVTVRDCGEQGIPTV
jgi:hypothetical protein